jgi:hypothetical protein
LTDEYYDALIVVEHEFVVASPSGMASANLVKTYRINSPDSMSGMEDAVEGLTLQIPGRVFVNYVEYENSSELVNASTLMQINVNGDTAEVIGLVDLSTGSWSLWDGPNVALDTKFNYLTEIIGGTSPMAGYLLVEILVFRKNQIRGITANSGHFVYAQSVEIIIGKGVVRSRGDSARSAVEPAQYDAGTDW